MTAFRSTHDRTGKASRMGARAESKFFHMAKAMGIKAIESSKNENIRQHIDAWIMLGDQEISVDVKGPKKFSDEGYVGIELKNVNGSNGWLYGEADWIAFQVGNKFHMIERGDLIDFVESKISKDNLNPNRLQTKLHNPAVAPAWYRRYDRPDEAMTYIKIDDIADKICWTWE